KGILPRGGVQDQKDVVGRFGVEAAEHAADFRQLVHQMLLVLEAACGVHDENVFAGGRRLLHSVEQDSRRVAALLAGNDRRADALAPDLELLDRGGTESIAGGEQDAIIRFLEPMAKLADRRRLARSVDADHEDHVWAGKAPDFQWFGDWS